MDSLQQRVGEIITALTKLEQEKRDLEIELSSLQSAYSIEKDLNLSLQKQNRAFQKRVAEYDKTNAELRNLMSSLKESSKKFIEEKSEILTQEKILEIVNEAISKNSQNYLNFNKVSAKLNVVEIERDKLAGELSVLRRNFEMVQNDLNYYKDHVAALQKQNTELVHSYEDELSKQKEIYKQKLAAVNFGSNNIMNQ